MSVSTQKRDHFVDRIQQIGNTVLAPRRMPRAQAQQIVRHLEQAVSEAVGRLKAKRRSTVTSRETSRAKR